MLSDMNSIPTQVQAVLDVFATALVDVRFADMDAAALARLAAEVNLATEAVQAAQVALEDAALALKERQNALLLHAQRALSYARVYAENDAALSERLDAISLPRAPRRVRTDDEALVLSSDPVPAPVRRKRSRAEPVAETELAAPG